MPSCEPALEKLIRGKCLWRAAKLTIDCSRAGQGCLVLPPKCSDFLMVCYCILAGVLFVGNVLWASQSFGTYGEQSNPAYVHVHAVRTVFFCAGESRLERAVSRTLDFCLGWLIIAKSLKMEACPICGMRVQWLADERVGRFARAAGHERLHMGIHIGLDCHGLAGDPTHHQQAAGLYGAM